MLRSLVRFQLAPRPKRAKPQVNVGTAVSGSVRQRPPRTAILTPYGHVAGTRLLGGMGAFGDGLGRRGDLLGKLIGASTLTYPAARMSQVTRPDGLSTGAVRTGP
jgi:hypothetical protein